MITLKSAIETAGRITTGNTKMPGTSFPISATRCQTGSKLAQVEGSVCSKCYALRLEAFRPSVHKGWEANYIKATTMIDRNPERWVDACAYQINRATNNMPENQWFHRWFDSGDLQSVAMLRAIVRVCVKTPDVRHWLPTREAGIVKEYLRQYGGYPANLVVRVSSSMIDDAPRGGYSHTSTVHRHGSSHTGEECQARTRNNQCGPCRACWDSTVANVSYPLH